MGRVSGRTPGGPSADQRRLVASSAVRRRRGVKALRKRVPTAAVVLLCVAGLAAAMTGAVSPMPALNFVNQGHWVYNSVLRAALHIDGATAHVDAQAPLTSDPGSQVVQGSASGYVVGKSEITVFGKSSLSVAGQIAPPSAETPLGLEVPGTPYLVYRKAGTIIRLGDKPVTIAVGGPIADPVFTSDGTLWLHRQDNGALCPLPGNAVTVSVCPATVQSGHTGALTVAGDRPVFLDTTSSTLFGVGMNGMAPGIPLGVQVSAQARPAPSDVAGKVAVLDPPKQAMYLVDPTGATPPVTVTLPKGDYSAPTSTGEAVALVDRRSDTVLTYDSAGKIRDTKVLPKDTGEPRVVRGEDNRVYVEGTSGTHVMVVDHDGGLDDVPITAPDQQDENTNAPPASSGTQPTPSRPDRDERATPQSPSSSSSDNQGQNEPPTVPPSPPGAPKSVDATGADASVTVTWGAAADNRASITGYRVTWNGGSTTVGGAARSTEVTGLTNGVSYTFGVTATNSVGRGPAASSNAVTPGSAPSAPRGVNADRSGTTAAVRWTAPADLGGATLQHYTVSASGMTAKNVTATSTSFTGLSTTAGQTITFTVKAVTRTKDGQTRTGPGLRRRSPSPASRW